MDRDSRTSRQLARKEAIATALAGALGALGCVAFWIGLCGGLTRWMAWAITVGGIVVLRRPIARALGQLVAAVRACPRWRLVAIVGLVLLCVGVAIFPPSPSDATRYHLVLAKSYAAHHHVAPVEFSRFPVFPQLNEMLFTWVGVLATLEAAALVQLLCAILLAVVLWAWAESALAPRSAPWVVALCFGSPIMLWLATEAHVDMGLTLFVTLAVRCFSLARGSDRQLALAGLFCGFAAATKYTGLFFCAFLFAWLAIAERNLRRCAIFVGAGILAAAPFYAYNWWHTGNPVFPFMAQLFGTGPWNADDFRAEMSQFSTAGLGRGPLALLLLPWNLTVHQTAFHAEYPVWPVPFVALVLLPPAWKRIPALRFPAAVAGGYMLFWFASAQHIRYLIPIFPSLSLLAIAAASTFLPATNRWLRSAGLCALWLPTLGLGVYRYVAQGFPPLSTAGREAYLRAHVPEYSLVVALEQQAGSNYRAYGFNLEQLRYHARGDLLGSFYGPTRFSDVEKHFGDPPQLRAAIERLGCDYFLLPGETPTVSTERMAAQGVRVIHRDANGRVFRVEKRP